MDLVDRDHAPRAVCSIDLDALLHNLAEVRRVTASGTAVCGVVKANAYGHGAVPVARALEAAGIEHMAVASLDEARELRRAGIASPLLVLGGVAPACAVEASALELSVVVWDAAAARDLAAALGPERRLRVHLKLDTGMHRIGAQEDDLDGLAAELRAARSLDVEGVMSHLACADEPRHPSVGRQIAEFERLLERLAALGIRPRVRHLANSAGLLADPRAHFDMVRVGLLLFGCAPHPALAARLDLRPVMHLRTRVSQVKRVPPGDSAGYGWTFTARRATTLAILPVGYALGYPRALSNRADVLVRGRRAPVAGTVSMDHVTVDVTDVPGVTVGDVVTLWGSDGGERIDVMELGARAGTIGYELLTGVSLRTPRTYVSSTEQTGRIGAR
ncbi:MAG: alanine racemase [Thermodesulfobacteriota bacterium]